MLSALDRRIGESIFVSRKRLWTHRRGEEARSLAQETRICDGVNVGQKPLYLPLFHIGQCVQIVALIGSEVGVPVR